MDPTCKQKSFWSEDQRSLRASSACADLFREDSGADVTRLAARLRLESPISSLSEKPAIVNPLQHCNRSLIIWGAWIQIYAIDIDT